MKYIANGWESYRKMCIPANASDGQVRECRQSFYAGAAILFQTIMVVLEPGSEPTDADLLRMSEVQAEVDAFGQELDKRAFGAQEH